MAVIRAMPWSLLMQSVRQDFDQVARTARYRQSGCASYSLEQSALIHLTSLTGSFYYQYAGIQPHNDWIDWFTARSTGHDPISRHPAHHTPQRQPHLQTDVGCIEPVDFGYGAGLVYRRYTLSISASTASERGCSQTSRFSVSCCMLVAPMMVLATNQRR